MRINKLIIYSEVQKCEALVLSWSNAFFEIMKWEQMCNATARRPIFADYWRNNSHVHQKPSVEKKDFDRTSNAGKDILVTNSLALRDCQTKRSVFGFYLNASFDRTSSFPTIPTTPCLTFEKKAKSTSSLLKSKTNHRRDGCSVSFDPRVYIYEFNKDLEQFASDGWRKSFY